MVQKSRRSFLKMLSSMSAIGAGGLGVNLLSMGNLAAQTSAGDYKALVCLFMFGGNDQTNLLIPSDTVTYNIYNKLRPALAIPQNDLFKLESLSNTGGEFGLHPQLKPIGNLFNQGKAALISNVGTLIAPITKAQYNNKSVAVPSKLFSHNDQQSTWQSLYPEGATNGWGGRIGDIVQSSNSYPIFTCVSANGSQTFLSGNIIRNYPVGYEGSSTILAPNNNLFGGSSSAIMRDLMTESRDNLFEDEHSSIIKRSIEANSILSTQLSSAPLLPLPAELANVAVAKQLRIVARMISIQASMGIKRQIFFVGIGGFDTHSNQLISQASLFNQVAKSIDYFYNATVSMGKENNVTTFTASDFGRTGVSNGDGSDHGWGSHHMVVGGAVKGKSIYGTFPTLSNNGPEDIGSRLIPTISVDQYAATLGSWFGVSESNLLTIFPNLKNFNNKNIGFV